jgi:hypothetical protein
MHISGTDGTDQLLVFATANAEHNEDMTARFIFADRAKPLFNVRIVRIIKKGYFIF